MVLLMDLLWDLFPAALGLLRGGGDVLAVLGRLPSPTVLSSCCAFTAWPPAGPPSNRWDSPLGEHSGKLLSMRLCTPYRASHKAVQGGLL